MNSVALIIFAKAPIPGTVKTRLIDTLGSQGSADLHKQLTTRCLEMAARSSRYAVNLWCTPTPDHSFFKALSTKFSVALRQQQGGDLGERMAFAIKEALKSNDIAIIIGSDCPMLTHRDLELIINKLENGFDASIIPAEDGGYVLLGLRKFSSVLFKEIEWGGKHVFEKTKMHLNDLSWNWYQHETFWDVDRPNDLQRLKSFDKLLPGTVIGNY